MGLLDLQIERAGKKTKRTLRLVLRVTERTIDKKGQRLLVPEIDIEGWWTSLDVPMVEVIELYKHHGTHEQFHPEIKTDLAFERLPSGKFDTHDAVVHLAAFAYNCLRLIGQLGLTSGISPLRHPAKRRRIKTVLQEVMYRAAKFVELGGCDRVASSAAREVARRADCRHRFVSTYWSSGRWTPVCKPR